MHVWELKRGRCLGRVCVCVCVQTEERRKRGKSETNVWKLNVLYYSVWVHMCVCVCVQAEEKKLVVEVTSVNVKRIDLKAYGVNKARCQVLLKVGGVEKRTTILPGLDPVWCVPKDKRRTRVQ